MSDEEELGYNRIAFFLAVASPDEAGDYLFAKQLASEIADLLEITTEEMVVLLGGTSARIKNGFLCFTQKQWIGFRERFAEYK
jgi:hypothetical protein